MKIPKFVFYFDNLEGKKAYSKKYIPNGLPKHYFEGKFPDTWYMKRGYNLYCGLLSLADYVGLNYEIKKTLTKVDPPTENTYNWYVIDVTGCADYTLVRPYIHCLKNISHNTLKWIDKNDVNIMIWYGEESQLKDFVYNWILPGIEKVINKIKHVSPINKSKVYFMSGNIGLTKMLANWHPKYDWKMADIGIFDVLFHKRTNMKDTASGRDIKVINKNIDIIKDKERSKYFTSFNGAIKQHRLYWVAEAHRRNLVEKGHMSFLGRYNALRGGNKFSSIAEYPYVVKSYCNVETDVDILEKYIRQIYSKIPIMLDMTNEEINHSGNDWSLPYEYVQDAYFSVVTESYNSSQDDTRSLHITEKSYKSFVNLQPFIILGDKHNLKYLRNQGYQTFPEFFDESYDEIDDGLERLFFCIEQIDILCQKPLEEVRELYQSVWKKLENNRHKFLNYNFNKKIEKILTKESFYSGSEY
ncbi:MAG: hypothetical protein H8E55_14225 [Pelagibacterales bacterium]|nr:hypothetical protein [Pelagibacterales bacterium]